jgi:integrase
VGTILSRKKKDGTPTHTATIIKKRDGEIVHRETKTFDRKKVAEVWIKKRETELDQPGAIERAQSKSEKVKLGQAIQRYIDESLKAIGKTKAQVLKTIKDEFDIAELVCDKITSADIVTLAQELAAGGRQPQTVGNYLSHLGAVFAIANAAWQYHLDPKAMADAFIVTRRLGLTAKSNEREKRPTLDELDLLLNHFTERQNRRPQSANMVKVIGFAIFSTRRQEEITRVKWADLDEKHSRVLVRDMKNPGEKVGNDVWCDLPDPALAIVKSMPRAHECIFPYTTDAIGASFTRACLLLGINTDDMPPEERLHFHDLRHDGVSRLFEKGLTIPHVAAASGHKSWTSLKRYTHLRQVGDKYAKWKWIPILTAQTKTPAA